MSYNYDKQKKNAINALKNILEQAKSDEWIVTDFIVDLDNDVSLVTNKEVEKVYKFGIQLTRNPHK